MSIIRVGSNAKYASGWDSIFGRGKAAGGTKKRKAAGKAAKQRVAAKPAAVKAARKAKKKQSARSKR